MKIGKFSNLLDNGEKILYRYAMQLKYQITKYKYPNKSQYQISKQFKL